MLRRVVAVVLAPRRSRPRPGARPSTAAGRARAEAEAASRRAAEESRPVARSLRDRGLTVRDVGYGSLPTARSTRANRPPGPGPQGRIPV